MGVIIYIFFLLVAGTFALAFLYRKYVRLNDITARIIEILGYLLLFVVLIWELVIKNLMMDSFYNSDFSHLNNKLNHLWFMIDDELKGDSVSCWKEYEEFFSVGPGKHIEEQKKCVDIIEVILKILSAVFIAIGRIQELIKNHEGRSVERD